jgi:hypothetical protein
MRPTISFLGADSKPIHVIGQFGFRKEISEKAAYKFYALLKLENPRNNILQYGVYFNYKYYNLHVAHRFRDGFVLGFCYYKNGFKFGYNNLYHYRAIDPGKFLHEFYISSRIKIFDNAPEIIKLWDY